MPTTINQSILQLLSIAERDAWNHRSEIRFAFFRPVSIQMNGKSYSAFSRDISASDIGLMHNMELPSGEVEIAIPADTGHTVKLQVRIEWCESCGEGWYISGGKFSEIKADAHAS